MLTKDSGLNKLKIGSHFLVLLALVSVFLPLTIVGPQFAYAVTDAGGSPYRTNIRVNPIPMFMGVFNIDADFVTGDAFTIGPSIGFLQASTELTNNSIQMSAWSLGTRLNYFFSGDAFIGGWFAAPSLALVPVSISETSYGIRYSMSQLSVGAGILVGYQIMWNGGMNLNVGFGATYFSTASRVTTKMETGATTKSTTTPSFAGIVPQIDLSLGWAF